MRGPRRTVAEQFARLQAAARAPVVYELHDGDSHGAEEYDVYEPLLAEDELPDEPPREEHGGQ